MGMHIAILPDADRGMPRWGVAPSHGFNGRIGIAAPEAVVQPEARQRHGEIGLVHTETLTFVHKHPDVGCALTDRHRRPASGAQNGSVPSPR